MLSEGPEVKHAARRISEANVGIHFILVLILLEQGLYHVELGGA